MESASVRPYPGRWIYSSECSFIALLFQAVMASLDMGNTPLETPLVKEGSSVFSLTFDEFQHALGNPSADFGSMNMDEFLKNLWTAEESQAMAAAINPAGGCNTGLATQMSLQKEGSFCLPRTLSTKTVDEVWKGLQPQLEAPVSAGSGGGQQQRQITLGEVTLEDFLVKAGIVKEGVSSNPSRATGQGNGGFPVQGNDARYNPSCNGNSFPVVMEPSGGGPSPMDVMQQDGAQGILSPVCTPGQQGDWIVHPSHPYKKGFSQKQQQVVPAYSNTSVVTNGACSGASPRAGGMGKGGFDISFGAGMHPNELGCGAALPLSPGPGESIATTSNLLGSQYGLVAQSGRKRCADGPIEKVIQRRQRRMIKNRESAARSRARKQAYTVELEAEVSQLKEENKKLMRKQEDEAELRRKQILAVMPSSVPKEGCALKRTFTGPW